MHFKIDETLLKKIETITSTDYGVVNGLIEPETVELMFDNLIYEIENLERKINEIEQDIENNYELKNINPYEEYGISERDFV